MMFRFIFASLLFVLLGAQGAFAQLLPRGLGAVYLNGREYNSNTPYYDATGGSSTLSERFDMDFKGDFLGTGEAGTDLKKLYDNIKSYDNTRGFSGGSLADQLELGSQRADVKTSLSARVIGFGYGYSDKWTFLLGLPIMSASVDADINVYGNNNALAIKNKLGDAAFDELKNGLDEASRVNKSTILDKIQNDYRYKDIRHWEYTGLGDVLVGGRTGWDFANKSGPGYSLLLTTYLSLPTGPQYDPDALAQVPLSRGYYAVDVTTDHKLQWQYFNLGSEVGGALALPHKTERRVPEGQEVLVSADRKVKVAWAPGPETWVSAYGGIGTGAYQSRYKIGWNEDFPDQFNGPIAGDYETMGRDMSSREIYHEISFTLSTVDYYKSQKFFMPFILTATAHESVAGRRTLSKKYFELTFMTFFTTPGRQDAPTAGSNYAMNKSKKN